MAKANRSGADALILDLEDSVPPSNKGEARRNVSAALDDPAGLPAYVRVNHPRAGDTVADIAALRGSRIDGVVLPKAERTGDVERVAALLADAEAALGRPEAPLAIVLMIETCLGLRNAFDLISASPRVRGVAMASAEEGDFIVDLGGAWTPSGEALLYPRSKLACDARAAGLAWLIDGVFMNLDSSDALHRESTLARNIGYTSKMAIHPQQVAVIHDVFTPSAVEIEYAQGLIAAFRDAELRGHGAVRYRGMMVDYANVRRAEQTLALARKG